MPAASPVAGGLGGMIALARAAQQQALKKIHAMKTDAVDASRPALTRFAAATESATTAEDPSASLARLSARIAEARLAQQQALSQLQAMQAVSGAVGEGAGTDLDARIGNAHAAQMQAMIRLNALNDSDGPADGRLLEDASGPVIERTLQDGHGPSDTRKLVDAIGPTIYHVITDAAMPAPLTAAPLTAAPLTAAPSTAVPLPAPAVAAATLPPAAIATPPAPIEAVPDLSGSSLSLGLAERMARIRAEQKETLEKLDQLSKDSPRQR